MCEFFSCLSDGNGKIYYFDAKLRKQCAKGKLNYESDSHTSIADYYGFTGVQEDKLNRWEYNPVTEDLKYDTINTRDDYSLVLEECKKLNFKKIKPEDEYCCVVKIEAKLLNMKQKCKVGDYLVIIADASFHCFDNGTIVKLTMVDKNEGVQGVDKLGTKKWLSKGDCKKLNIFQYLAMRKF